MVGAANALIRHRGHAKITKRLHPRGQHGPRLLVALQVDAAILTGPIVLIEIGRQFLVRRLYPDASIHRIAKVLFDVRARTEESLFLTGPQGDANRASGLRSDGLENPHRFHCHRHARRVVAGVRARVPGIQMRTNHHHFVWQVTAGDLANEIHRLLDLVANLVPHLDLDLHRNVSLENAVHAVVVLWCDGHDHRRRHHACPRPAIRTRSWSRESANSAKPATLTLQHRSHPFGGVERDLLVGGEQVRVAHCARWRWACRRDDCLLKRFEVFLGHARHAIRERREVDRCRRRNEHRFAFQRAAIFCEVRLDQQLDDHSLCRLLALGARRVRDRIANHRRVVGFEQVQRDVFVVPCDTKVHERLGGHIHEAHARHLALHPGLSALHVA